MWTKFAKREKAKKTATINAKTNFKQIKSLISNEGDFPRGYIANDVTYIKFNESLLITIALYFTFRFASYYSSSFKRKKKLESESTST